VKHIFSGKDEKKEATEELDQSKILDFYPDALTDRLEEENLKIISEEN